MNKFKKLMALVSVMVLAMGLNACGSKESASDNGAALTPTEVITGAVTPEETSEAEPAQEAAEPVTDAAQTVYPVTVTDSYGEEIVIETEPLKIVSLGPNITEMIYSLGVQEKLAGRTDYCDYPAEVTEIETVGTLRKPDIEKIVSLEPDLVIASTHFDDDSKTALENAGITVLYLYEEHDISGVYTMLETLGTALNANENAAQTVDAMKEIVAEVTNKVAGLDPVSVYYVVGFGEYGEYTAGGDTFIGELLTMAGGDNIAKDVSGWSYSLESLMEADPEVIILPEYSYDEFTTTEPYSTLSAVVNGKVYTIDNNMLDRQCARNAEALLEVAKMLHPEKFEK